MKKYSWKWFGEMLWGKKETFEEKVDKFAAEVAKPYKSAKLIGSSAIFVLQSGTTLEKLDCKEQDFEKLLQCTTEQEIIHLISKFEDFEKLLQCTTEQKILISKFEVLDTKKELKVVDFSILKETGEFEVNEGVVKLKGVDRSLPALLVNKFVEIVKTDEFYVGNTHFISLKNFWYWLCLNPFPEVVANLYDFLHKGDFKITKDGMFLAYRRVCKVTENTELVEFISNSYVKIKGWKKSPKNFWVWGEDDGSYTLIKGKPVEDGIGQNMGNLAELYENLDTMEENRYTDNHTGTFDIRIGKTVSIPRSECTHSNADCGTGGLMCSPLI